MILLKGPDQAGKWILSLNRFVNCCFQSKGKTFKLNIYAALHKLEVGISQLKFPICDIKVFQCTTQKNMTDHF